MKRIAISGLVIGQTVSHGNGEASLQTCIN